MYIFSSINGIYLILFIKFDINIFSSQNILIVFDNSIIPDIDSFFYRIEDNFITFKVNNIIDVGKI